MVAIRAIIATIVLYAVMTMTRRPMRQSRDSWRLGSVMAALNLVLPFVLITYAYRYASAGFVGFLIALVPIGTAMLAHYVLPNEPLHVAKLVGLGMALAGVGLLLLSGDSGLAEGGRPLLAGTLTTLGVVAIAFSGVYAKRHAHSYDPITLTMLQFALGAVVLILVGLVVEGVPTDISAWGWTLIVYLSVIGSVVPFVLYYWVLRHVSSTKASMIGYLVPLVALGSGMALLDEQLQFGIAVGGMLILAGVLLTDRAERRFARL
jgi:drug/metabolite transporter (DMT)-like permease